MLQELLQKLEKELECAGDGGETVLCDGLDSKKVWIVGIQRDSVLNPSDETA